MADLSSLGDFVKAIVDFIAGFVPEGPLRTLVVVIYGICGAAGRQIYKYYLGVLAQGAKPENSIERQDYDRLRAGLKEGNLAARLYAKWLTKFLDWIERFFGDAGMAQRTPLMPRFLRLEKPAPLWTAPALDRCLLLALIYPIATIYLMWAMSGHVGPAEKALFIPADVAGWQRAVSVGSVGLFVLVLWRSFLNAGLRRLIWPFSALAVVFATAVTYAAIVAVSPAIVAVSSVGVAVAAAIAAGADAIGAVVVALTVGAIAAGAASRAGAAAGATAAAGVVAAAFAVATVSKKAIDHGWHGNFLAVFFASMIAACIAGVSLLAPRDGWQIAGPALFFLSLLTLLNAPFDWASLGLTRALLRRGLELGGWWPYLLALVDACLAGVIIALLALTMAIGVQAFDELAVHGGGTNAAVLPLDQLFDGIAQNPGAPEYWWALRFCSRP